MSTQIDRFLSYLERDRGSSPNTITAYKNDLKQFLTFLQLIQARLEGGLIWAGVTPKVVVEFMEWRRANGAADAAVARKVAALKSFFRFLAAEGVLPQDPLEDLPYPHANKPPLKILPEAVVEKLIAQLPRQNSEVALRDRAMLLLLCTTGVKTSELVSLEVGCIKSSADGKCQLACYSASGKKRLIPIIEEVAATVRGYTTLARPRLLRNPATTALFVSRRGDRLTRQGFLLILKGYAKAAGIVGPVSPQTLRHLFAARLLGNGFTIGQVGGLLGHNRTQTTAKMYAGLASNPR